MPPVQLGRAGQKRDSKRTAVLMPPRQSHRVNSAAPIIIERQRSIDDKAGRCGLVPVSQESTQQHAAPANTADSSDTTVREKKSNRACVPQRLCLLSARTSALCQCVLVCRICLPGLCKSTSEHVSVLRVCTLVCVRPCVCAGQCACCCERDLAGVASEFVTTK